MRDLAQHEFPKIEEVFVRLAFDAGKRLLEFFNRDPAVEWKSDGTPVTEADRAADSVICRGLASEFPEIPIISEECCESHGQLHKRFFLVDPLDGTRAFCRGQPEFTVNIALIDNGVPVAGVLYSPVNDRLFVTEGGVGVAEKHGLRSRRHEARCGLRKNSLRLVGSRSISRRYRFEDCGVSSVELMSSSIKFALIACGEADVYPRWGTTMEWDTAAGHALLRAVGCEIYVLSALENRATLRYGKLGYRNPGFLATIPGVVGRIPEHCWLQ